MKIKIGEIAGLFRYPVKSMGGESLESATLGWHGVDGDRRLGLRRVGDQGGFPWLTASRLPELILFAPVRRERGAAQGLPTHVRTPDGEELELFSEELDAEIARRHGAPIELTHLDRGIFDEASISAITSATVGKIADFVDKPADVRRFRPNIVIAMSEPEPFAEDAWVGGVLSFGDGDEAAAVAVTNHDERCAMINFDPDSAESDPELLKAVVRERDNKAGVYGSVFRRGRVAVGQSVYFAPAR